MYVIMEHPSFELQLSKSFDWSKLIALHFKVPFSSICIQFLRPTYIISEPCVLFQQIDNPSFSSVLKKWKVFVCVHMHALFFFNSQTFWNFCGPNPTRQYVHAAQNRAHSWRFLSCRNIKEASGCACDSSLYKCIVRWIAVCIFY